MIKPDFWNNELMHENTKWQKEMIPDLTPSNISKYKKDTLRSGINGFEGIKTLQLDQLEDAVTKELHAYQDRFLATMKENPNYKYPPHMQLIIISNIGRIAVAITSSV